MTVLDDLANSNAIRKKEEPTEFVPKPVGKRVSLFTKLNKYVSWPIYPFTLVHVIVQSIPAYLPTPMGLSSSSDEWCLQPDWAIEDMPFPDRQFPKKKSWNWSEK